MKKKPKRRQWRCAVNACGKRFYPKPGNYEHTCPACGTVDVFPSTDGGWAKHCRKCDKEHVPRDGCDAVPWA